jgi:hypothetical protein
MIAGERTKAPKSSIEAEDHNTGVSLWRGLHAFRTRQSRASKRFFLDLVQDARVTSLLDEVAKLAKRHREQAPMRAREAFDRLMRIQSREFAETEARKLRDLVASAAAPRASIH